MTSPLKALHLSLFSMAFAFGASAQSTAAASRRPHISPKISPRQLDLVEFEGKLADSSGNPLDGSFLLKFELYDAPEGGSRRWDESFYVNVREGRYRAELGRLKPIPRDVFAGGYRLTVSPPEGTGWLAAGVKPPQQISVKPATKPSEPAPRAPEEAAAPAKEKIVERSTPAQIEVEAPEPAAEKRGQGSSVYEVRPGDTLRSVALKLYGNADRWVDLYQANDDRILRGGDLVPGQKLIVPGDGGKTLR